MPNFASKISLFIKSKYLIYLNLQMLLKAVRYITLFLITLNFPGWVLVYISPTYSSALSYLSFGLMLIFFLFFSQKTLNLWMITLGVLYFGIGSLVDQTYISDEINYFITIAKFFIVIIAGYSVVKATSNKELFIFLIVGALTVFLQIFFFFNPLTDGGRYSGFYLNPNSLGFICMMGYALSYSVEKKWRFIGQIIFTIVGFLTFSRTFIVVWLFINILSIGVSIKNIRILAVGLSLFIGLLIFNSFLPKSNPRLDAMTKIFEGKSDNTADLKEDGRTKTWAIYYPALFEKPLFGQGHNAFAGGAKVSPVGPHNAYIKTMGEGGLPTLLVMLIFYTLMLKTAWSQFKQHPHLFLMIIALLLFMATNHSYWTNGYLMFFSMWLQYQVFKKINNISSIKEQELQQKQE